MAEQMLNSQFTSALLDLLKEGTSARYVVEMLIDNGANVNVNVNDGQTPLMIYLSSSYCDLDVLRILLANEANANARDNWGASPMLWAANKGLLQAAQLLLKYGAEVEVKNGRVPLIEAAANGHRELVEFLLQNGAKIDTGTSYSGATALHLAALHGHPEVVTLLMAMGADPKSTDDEGATPFDYTSRDKEHTQGSKEVELILKALNDV